MLSKYLQISSDATTLFMESISKSERKKYGQFFTSPVTASFMASLIHVDFTRESLNLLDAGSGTGILSVAAVEYLIEAGYQGDIRVVCYETDEKVLPVLRRNMEQLQEQFHIHYEIKTDDFLLENDNNAAYDIVIGNPPYKKIGKDAPEALAFPYVCHGAPNLYFLFWTRSIDLLCDGGELVYIIPRSWTSGAYFAKFREYLFAHCVITHLHLFASRDKVFDGESVLQETMIIKVTKTTERPEAVRITSSSTSDLSDIQEFLAPYNVVVSGNQFVFLVTNEEEAATLNRLAGLNNTLSTIGHPMKTGLIVDFRTREVLRNEQADDTYPLFYSQHIRNGRVTWPVGKEDEYICTDRAGFLQENTNYVLVKRFTAKEERRRLQSGIYLQSDHPEYAHISTQNKVNFIKCDTPEQAYGIFVIMNSTLYDTWYRILNGSTQVNSTEINLMPVPSEETIIAMGAELMGQELTEENCNQIINRWIN